MPYDEQLAGRTRVFLRGMRGQQEKKVFGGVGFRFNGKGACSVHRDTLLARVEGGKTARALGRPDRRPFEITNQPMPGGVVVTCGEGKSSQGLGRAARGSWAVARAMLSR